MNSDQNPGYLVPIGSMYGIFTYFGLKFMVNLWGFM